MSDHTPEPWRLRIEDYGDEIWFGGDGEGMATVEAGEPYPHSQSIAYIGLNRKSEPEESPEYQANARRIVACVNACAGILTEVIESFDGVQDVLSSWKTQQRELTALRQQVADLRAALARVVVAMETYGPADQRWVDALVEGNTVLAATQPQEVQP